MRVFWAYALSGIVHVATIAALAYWLPGMPPIEIRLRRGDSVVLSASFSAPAAPAEQTQAVTIAPDEPTEPLEPAPAPELETTETLESAVSISAVSISAAPVEVERSEYEVDVAARQSPADPAETPRAVAAASRQPQTRDQPPPPVVAQSAVLPPRKVDQPSTQPVGEVTSAAPFQSAAEIGSQVDELPSQYTSNRKPPYPTDALLARIEGVVRLRVQIDSSGRVIEVRLERSSGTPSLDQSAISGVRQWRFSPARRGGSPVPYEVIVPVRFSIRS